MKRQLAHTLRRTARRLIRWSNRLDGPAVDGLARPMGFAGQQAGIAFDALLETLVQDGKYPSKGVAAEKLGINRGLPGLTDSLNSWLSRPASGLAGERPALPNVASKPAGLWARLRSWFMDALLILACVPEIWR